jgi:hypothetical protein
MFSSHSGPSARRTFIAACTAAACASAIAAPALSDTQAFSGPLASTRAAFTAAAGCGLKTESFDSMPAGSSVNAMPGVDAVMTNENAAGQAVGFPVLAGSQVSAPNWVTNFGNGRPAWSPWVIRPTDGEAIYAFGQANAQGDWVRVDGYDASNALAVSVTAPAIVSGGFAGFVTTTPILRVVVTPLGNFDGLNGMDDVAVSVVPLSACAGDLSGDGVIDGQDLGMLLGAWDTPEADLTCDGTTNGADLGVLLGGWGKCQ